MFKKPDLSALKRPDFSSLAFWKKDQSEVPPPPAHHFDPAPASGPRWLTPILPTFKQNSMQWSESARMQQEKHEAKPIRKSYSLGKSRRQRACQQQFFRSKNDAKAVSYVPELDSTIEQAQQDFSSAIANTKQSVERLRARQAQTQRPSGKMTSSCRVKSRKLKRRRQLAKQFQCSAG